MALIEIDRSKMSKEDRDYEDFCRMANTKVNRDAFKLIQEGFRCSTGKGIGKIEGNFNKNSGKSTITITDTPNDPGQRMINEGFNQLFQNLLPIDKVIIK